MKYLMGVDLGGTKISAAISDLDGNILSKLVVPTGAAEGEEAVMGRILSSLHELLNKFQGEPADIACIGVGTPGIISKKEGRIHRAYNLPFTDYDLLSPLKDRFGVTCILENDANAAALGEYHFGQGRGMEHLIYLTISTGVGGAAIMGGKLLEGISGNAFEVGHMILDPRSDKICGCGLTGDVEALCSGTAMGRRGMEAVTRGEDTLLTGFQNITTMEIHEAYLRGDAVSEKILREAFNYVGITAANLITLYNPQVVVIGGGVSAIGDFFFDAVRESAEKSCLQFLYEGCRILPSALGQDTGVKGALAVAKSWLLESGRKDA